MKLNLKFVSATIEDAFHVFEGDVSESDLKMTCVRLVSIASNLLGIVEGLTRQETQQEDGE